MADVPRVRPWHSPAGREELLAQAQERYAAGDGAGVLALIGHREPVSDSGEIDRLGLLKALALYDVGDAVGCVQSLKAGLVRARTASQAERFNLVFALFLREADFQSPDEALPGLANLRQLASSIGDAQSMAGLHLAVARLEGLRGLCVDAHRHLEVARRLALQGAPSGLQHAISLADASLESLSGNIERARRRALDCLSRARESNQSRYLTGAASLLVQIETHAGNVKDARAYVELVRRQGHSAWPIPHATLDNVAQLEIATGHLSECHRALEHSLEIASKCRLPARSWNDLETDQTRCAYLERKRDWEGILAVVAAADPELERRQFRAIRTTLLCARARALGHLGDHEGAEAAISEASSTVPRGAIDSQITLEASKGLCLSLRGHTARGRRHFERAVAACRAIGHRYHEQWTDHLRGSLEPRSRSDAAGAVRTRDLTDTALLLSDVSTMLGAGHSLDLLSQRALDILQSTSLAGRVSLQVESGLPYQPTPAASWSTTGTTACEIRITGSDRALSISAAGLESLDELALLKSVADLAHAAARRTADAETDDDRQNLWPRTAIEGVDDSVFQSPRMIELLRIAARLADTNLPVLITGETGTGKEILARLIHDESRVRRGPFVPFNCSAIPRELVESQLFGHRRGAFTGAMDAAQGVIRAAEHGTLFLDEIGDLDLAAQPKLLRFLEGGEVHPVGEARAQRVVVRIVAATNSRLDDLVAQGRFRSDLFYRVGVTRIELPPLRERKDEIPAFAAMFLKRYSLECGRSGLRLGDDFIAALLLHDWPGNIRQLANEVRRVVALASDGQTLGAEHLAHDLARAWNARTPMRTAADDPGPGIRIRLDQTLAAAIEELEQKFIEHAMDLAGGRVAPAAKRLGLSRKGLFLKRRRRGLTGPSS